MEAKITYTQDALTEETVSLEEASSRWAHIKPLPTLSAGEVAALQSHTPETCEECNSNEVAAPGDRDELDIIQQNLTFKERVTIWVASEAGSKCSDCLGTEVAK